MVMEDWEKEHKKWWRERHQQEERWKREWEAWEREREEFREQAEQLRQAKESLLSQSKQDCEAHETLRVQHEHFRKIHEQLCQAKDALLNENEQFRKQRAEFESQREQMCKAQEDLLCQTDQVRQAHQADRVEVKDLYQANLNLMKVDLEKTEKIRHYQAQQGVLEQEIQQCKQDVECLMKEQLPNITQTLRGLRTPSQQSQVPAESHLGSVAHSHKSASPRESHTRAPVDLGSSHIIDAHPLSQALTKPFQFATSSQHSGVAASQSQGGEKGKARGGPERVQSLKKSAKVTPSSPSQDLGSTIWRGIKIISATAPDNIYHPSGRGHAIGKGLGQGVSHSASSPIVGEKPVLTLPPRPSRTTSSKSQNLPAGSQSNFAQGATSYLSSVKCPDMELFQEDRSFMTEVSLLGGEEEPAWDTSGEEELLDEAAPPKELVGGPYAGVSKPISSSMAREPLHPVSFPYQDYRFESSKIPKRDSCQSGSAQGSAVAVPDYNSTASRGRGNLSGEAHRGAPRVGQ